MKIVQDRVLLVLCLGGWLALLFGGFLNSAANRLAGAAAHSIWQAPWPDAAALTLALAFLTAAVFLRVRSVRTFAALLGATLVLLTSLYVAGEFAAALTSPAQPAARQSLGPAFWILVGVAALAMLQALQAGEIGLLWRVAHPIAIGIALAGMIGSGRLDDLSLMREFMTQRAIFAAEFWRHIALVAASLAGALLFGLPLTSLALRRASLRTIIFASLNILQTIPSIAIFGLLIAPLSGLVERWPLLGSLGIGGTGATPAIIALTLYALLPLVRNFSTGIAEVPAYVKDAARGLGFDNRRMFFAVELPLALPALISGLRIVTVQSIGLAAVAALIGAGGLGTFVFEGIGQYALDLVLLGALPIILLALAADSGFRLLRNAAWRQA
jgi:osmoprotectant transport system permease protein